MPLFPADLTVCKTLDCKAVARVTVLWRFVGHLSSPIHVGYLLHDLLASLGLLADDQDCTTADLIDMTGSDR